MASYDHKAIESKWQGIWEASRVPVTERPGVDTLYHLVMFPYPSGAGLHVGHVESYAALDILTRRARMQGKNVLFPIGFDSFGLPAENFAIKSGVHPIETTHKAIETFRTQMKSLGLSFDWDREISTCEPEYYKWTQWMFLQLYKQGLAYRAAAPVNYCPKDQTVLANEQVVQGACERCGSVVEQKHLTQWFFRITKYADRLLAGLDALDWPERIKAMQRNWIGKSEGAEITFTGVREEREFSINVFTTRPDTLFGVQYVVLAPEHPLVDDLTSIDQSSEMEAYRAKAKMKSELERTQLEKDKEGVFTGSYVRHPFTGEAIAVWVSDYVLTTYGTGAVMGVPAHDERDWAFAKKYGMTPVRVISIDGSASGVLEEAYVESGVLVNSSVFDGLSSVDAKQKIVAALEEKGLGQRMVNFRVRDWLVSRQRYWGAPIPIIWCEEHGAVPVPEDQLPVVLPRDVDFSPTGESPLAKHAGFHAVNCPTCGKSARRESDTMDTFVDSSWYFLRYCDPKNDAAFADPQKMDYWMPVDLCMGGAEHAVLHLLYSRFFCYALHDMGYLPFEEPFHGLRNQGLILGPDGEKMSKSKGNVVNPDDVVAEFGADALRIYEMFMGPIEDAKPWDTKGLVGVRRFLDKVWMLRERVSDGENASLAREVAKATQRVHDDLDALKFNTAVSGLMVCANACASADVLPRGAYATFIQLLAPFAPHLAEACWAALGNTDSVFAQPWPKADVSLLKDAQVTLAVQVNGKLRGTLSVAAECTETEARELALADENVHKHLEGKEIVKTVFVPGRLISFVIR